MVSIMNFLSLSNEGLSISNSLSKDMIYATLILSLRISSTSKSTSSKTETFSGFLLYYHIMSRYLLWKSLNFCSEIFKLSKVNSVKTLNLVIYP